MRLFPFMTPSTMLISPNMAYGYSLRPYRIFAYAVWILVLCAVLLFYMSNERGKKKQLFGGRTVPDSVCVQEQFGYYI